MKKFVIILLAISFVSCNPFISKELRRKKKCNRKLERVIDKCPELLNQDTIIDTIEVFIPEVKIDSFFVIEKDSNEIDSLVNLIRNKKTREIIRQYIYKYVPLKDTIIQLADGYTIKYYSADGNIHYSIEKPSQTLKIENETIIDIIKPVELTTMEKILDFLSRFWWWIVIGLIVFFGLRFIKKQFF